MHRDLMHIISDARVATLILLPITCNRLFVVYGCTQSHGSTPLLLACKNNRLSTAKMLIERHCNVNATTKLMATPLIAASSHGHAAVVKLLLVSGADRTMSVDGMTALTLAKRGGKTEVVTLLESAGDKRKPAGDERRGVWSGKLGVVD